MGPGRPHPRCEVSALSSDRHADAGAGPAGNDQDVRARQCRPLSCEPFSSVDKVVRKWRSATRRTRIGRWTALNTENPDGAGTLSASPPRPVAGGGSRVPSWYEWAAKRSSSFRCWLEDEFSIRELRGDP